MVNKNIIMWAILPFFAINTYAQPMGEPVVDSAPVTVEDKGSLSFLDELDAQAESVSNARKSADEYLMQKGWVEGLNPKTNRYVVVASGNISKSPSDKDFQTAREIAYSNAMLMAKKNIATYYGQELETAMKRVLKEPKSADAQRKDLQNAQDLAKLDPGFYEKIKNLANKKLDDELAKEGITYDSPKADAIIDNVLNTTSFTETIKTTAAQQVGALVTSKIFEQDGEIVVVAYYSTSAKELAAAINGKPVNIKVKPRVGDPVGIWIKKLKKSQLYSSMGVQFTSDEDGNIVMVSYGQSKGRSQSGSSKEIAIEKAILNADANIRRFAGETVVYNAAKTSAEDRIELGGGNAQTVSDIVDSVEQEISAVAAKLMISGISTIHTWDLVDPRSDSLICGVVRVWSIKTADIANESREDMKDATINRGGRMAVPTSTKSASGSSLSTSGASSSNTYKNVDTTKYKTESIESEDF